MNDNLQVEIYFEPGRLLAEMIEHGANIGLPLQQGVPAAIRTADGFLDMDGKLIAHASRRNLAVQVVEQMTDSEWAHFLGSRCEAAKRWKRWNGETSQGRWNVVVILGAGP